ncbi:MAG: peptide chain release factor N(5)-glutamine methyltransferase [Alphaproteobacteria bacterium]|jgi:release factor glutamine methyltransferase|nr:peptide chain release factor N(5)-glutamine methyltransferase [Alphaproteobacteria bacterium]MDP6566366.1 peptide chain release factor N(5)-glutamine methyltransferase [Alphaproteobacteria bacterium]MDP6814751.1 peptide chain release factor N(5)-glutamine methyltransferase [Alphaproteobacteria bacterium]
MARAGTEQSLGEAAAAARRRLRGAGVGDAGLDASVLLAHALGTDRLALIRDPDRRLSPAETARYETLIGGRAARQPVSRLLGRREFWGLDFNIGPAVLDPRPDSETLVEAALALSPANGRPRRIADLGTGSGCLLLALLYEWPAAWGLGLDIDPAAIAVARHNAARLDLAARSTFLVTDWAAAVDAAFDLVVANPPYIASATIGGLSPEVGHHDPRLALDGGPDGLAAYRAIAGELARLLAPGGQALLECGVGQADAVADLLAGERLDVAERRCDLGGVERCLVVRRRR